MNIFYAVMKFGGTEFPAEVEAETKTQAYEFLRDQYPESTAVQVHTREEMLEIEMRRLASFDEDDDDGSDDACFECGEPLYNCYCGH